MIPENIKKEHILKAIEKIERAGIPKGRSSQKFILEYRDKHYPPKYVISLANKYVNGKELDSAEFSGGQETNNFLKWLGFDIVETFSSLTFVRPIFAKNKTFEKTQKKHDERCPECKKTVEKMLREIFGKVESNYKFEVSTSPEEYRGFPLYQNLKEILLGLEKHRGHMDFVRTPTLPPCDFFVPKPGFIVEFDESQHFTLSRKISLQNYPQSLRLGFSLTKWITLCEKISAKDNDPPFRDEQRAWYDTLRDFVPELKGLEPTVRLYSREMKWCSLNPKKTEDIAKFRVLIENTRRKSSSWVATVVLQSNEEYSNHNRRRLKALSQIVDTVANEIKGNGVILFPGGWFNANKQEARSLYKWVEKNVRKILAKNKGNIVICLGIDGKYDEGKDQSKDQIAIAISKRGIRAIGRKFHPTKDEKGNIKTANNYSSMEEGKPRIFSLNGKKYFLAVCYDGFGIRQERIPNFGINVILDLVHGFGGGYGKGHPYFAKHGFAGASKEWGCLVFGAAVFFHPIKPKNWPSGVYWNRGKKSTQKWKYKDNPIKPIKIKELPNIKEGIASIRIYNLKMI